MAPARGSGSLGVAACCWPPAGAALVVPGGPSSSAAAAAPQLLAAGPLCGRSLSDPSRRRLCGAAPLAVSSSGVACAWSGQRLRFPWKGSTFASEEDSVL